VGRRKPRLIRAARSDDLLPYPRSSPRQER